MVFEQISVQVKAFENIPELRAKITIYKEVASMTSRVHAAVVKRRQGRVDFLFARPPELRPFQRGMEVRTQSSQNPRPTF